MYLYIHSSMGGFNIVYMYITRGWHYFLRVVISFVQMLICRVR